MGGKALSVLVLLVVLSFFIFLFSACNDDSLDDLFDELTPNKIDLNLKVSSPDDECGLKDFSFSVSIEEGDIKYRFNNIPQKKGYYFDGIFVSLSSGKRVYIALNSDLTDDMIDFLLDLAETKNTEYTVDISWEPCVKVDKINKESGEVSVKYIGDCYLNIVEIPSTIKVGDKEYIVTELSAFTFRSAAASDDAHKIISQTTLSLGKNIKTVSADFYGYKFKKLQFEEGSALTEFTSDMAVADTVDLSQAINLRYFKAVDRLCDTKFLFPEEVKNIRLYEGETEITALNKEKLADIFATDYFEVKDNGIYFLKEVLIEAKGLLKDVINAKHSYTGGVMGLEGSDTLYFTEDVETVSVLKGVNIFLSSPLILKSALSNLTGDVILVFKGKAGEIEIPQNCDINIKIFVPENYAEECEDKYREFETIQTIPYSGGLAANFYNGTYTVFAYFGENSAIQLSFDGADRAVILKYAFINNESIEKITLDFKEIVICDFAFYNAKNLSEFSHSTSNVKAGEYSFACTSLFEFYTSNEIKPYAFYGVGDLLIRIASNEELKELKDGLWNLKDESSHHEFIVNEYRVKLEVFDGFILDGYTSDFKDIDVYEFANTYPDILRNRFLRFEYFNGESYIAVSSFNAEGTYRAVWEPKGVRFVLTTGYSEAESVFVYYDDTFTLNVPEIAGHRFDGWYMLCGEEKIPITDSEGNSLSPCGFDAGEIILYPELVEVKISFILTFIDGLNNRIELENIKGQAWVMPDSKPHYYGFTFIGWYIDTDSGRVYLEEGGICFADGPMEVYAEYREVDIDVVLIIGMMVSQNTFEEFYGEQVKLNQNIEDGMFRNNCRGNNIYMKNESGFYAINGVLFDEFGFKIPLEYFDLSNGDKTYYIYIHIPTVGDDE
ncbi:MAG: leucine-rich repeat protein [Clostridiales bacterium]|nr:leucine-rich repeat protein [Clostridiales bacterium]